MKNKRIKEMPNQVWHNIKLCLILSSLLGMVSAANIAYIPKTAPGNTLIAGAGKQWPTNRFVESGDCVTDRLTGLMWAKNGIIGFTATTGGSPIAQPSYTNTDSNLNLLNWTDSKTAISNMNSATNKLCGYNDWRLPDVNELSSLINYAAVKNGSNPADWLNSQGFSNIQSNDVYWSSTVYDGSKSWYAYFSDGVCFYDSVSGPYHVVPVRGGQ